MLSSDCLWETYPELGYTNELSRIISSEESKEMIVSGFSP